MNYVLNRTSVWPRCVRTVHRSTAWEIVEHSDIESRSTSHQQRFVVLLRTQKVRYFFLVRPSFELAMHPTHEMSEIKARYTTFLASLWLCFLYHVAGVAPAISSNTRFQLHQWPRSPAEIAQASVFTLLLCISNCFHTLARFRSEAVASFAPKKCHPGPIKAHLQFHPESSVRRETSTQGTGAMINDPTCICLLSFL